MHVVPFLMCGSAALCYLLSFPILLKQGATADGVETEFRGRLGSCWVEASGRIQFELRGAEEGHESAIWFDAPAGEDPLLEHLVLELLIHGSTKNASLAVVANASSGDDGSEPGKAFDFVRMGFCESEPVSAPRPSTENRR